MQRALPREVLLAVRTKLHEMKAEVAPRLRKRAISLLQESQPQSGAIFGILKQMKETSTLAQPHYCTDEVWHLSLLMFHHQDTSETPQEYFEITVYISNAPRDYWGGSELLSEYEGRSSSG